MRGRALLNGNLAKVRSGHDNGESENCLREVKAAYRDMVRASIGRRGADTYLIGFEVSTYASGKPTPVEATRIINTPICEESVANVAVGASRTGAHVYADFMFDTFLGRVVDPLVNQIAVSRACRCEAGCITASVISGPLRSAGVQHDGRLSTLFDGVPGATVLCPTAASQVACALNQAPARCGLRVLLMTTEGRRGNFTCESLSRLGGGAHQAVVCSGQVMGVVADAVEELGSERLVDVLCPAVLWPPSDSLVASIARRYDRCLIVDIGPRWSAWASILCTARTTGFDPSRTALWEGEVYARSEVVAELARKIGAWIE